MIHEQIAYLQSELEELRALIADYPAGMPGRIGLQAREAAIREELGELGTQAAGVFASLKIAFEGPPVLGQSSGIEPKFAGEALSGLGTFLARMEASGAFGERSGTSGFYIADVVKSSFGFELKEHDPQGRFDESTDYRVVEESMRLLSSVLENEGEIDEDLGGDLSSLVLTSLRDFLETLDNARVTLKFETNELSESWRSSQISTAYEKLKETQVVDEELTKHGMLVGFTPSAGKFEFIPFDGEMIKGRIADGRSVNERIEHYSPLMNEGVEVTLIYREVTRKTRTSKSYRLIDAELSEQVQRNLDINRDDS